MIRHLVLGLALTGGATAQAACSEEAVTLVGEFGRARFAVEIADTAEERAQGLMFVEEMPAFAGMLFLYDRPQPVAFWMKNTYIPLDMLFADDRGVILRIAENAVPGDLTPIDGGPGVLAVLEINGGMAARLGLEAGDLLQHPAFGEDAAAPCVDPQG